MKIFNWLSILTICCFFLLSCSKTLNEKEVETEIYKSSIKSCSCSASKADGYRIEAAINGERVCFDKLWHPNSLILDEWMQTFRNAIYVERVNADSTVAIRIQYNNPSFNLLPLPHIVDSTSVEYCEVIQIEIMNLIPFKLCSCSTDDSYYTALSSVSNLSSRILSFNENVIEATFEGDFINRGGKKFQVSNGYFKIELQIVK